MPNWCRNRVTAYARNGNEQDIQKIQEIFESKDTVFGKIIPSPDWDNTPNEDGELPVRKEHKNPKTGEVSFVTMEFPKSGKNDSRWYDWNISNWGTKWDINGSVEVDDYDSEQIEINFNTAWGSCRGMRKIKGYVPRSWI